MDDFIVYRRFDDAVLADAMIALLEKHDIDYQVDEVSTNINPLAPVSHELSKEYVIRVHPDDFILANQSITEEEHDFSNIDSDYYLFNFTTDELTQLVKNADEWSAFDYQLAQKILVGRGVHIDEETLTTLHHDRMEELSEPQAKQVTWIIIGYITALAGGVLGIFIGLHLSTHKKTLPNGKQVYDYSEADRQQGRQIFYLGILMVIVMIGYRIYSVNR